MAAPGRELKFAKHWGGAIEFPGVLPPMRRDSVSPSRGPSEDKPSISRSKAGTDSAA